MSKRLAGRDLTVLRIVRPHATDKERDRHRSVGLSGSVTLKPIWCRSLCASARRFGQEHGYRFDKQALLWTQARLRTPAQFERWSHIVAITHNHLILARDLVEPVMRQFGKQAASAHPATGATRDR